MFSFVSANQPPSFVVFVLICALDEPKPLLFGASRGWCVIERSASGTGMVGPSVGVQFGISCLSCLPKLMFAHECSPVFHFYAILSLTSFLSLLNFDVARLCHTSPSSAIMSILPLPPAAYGPIYPTTPVSHLTGVAMGWDALVTGSVSGNLVDLPYTHPGTPNTGQWIMLDVFPQGGELIIVEQYSIQLGHPVGGGRSLEKAIQVPPLPSPDLPCLIVTGPVQHINITLHGVVKVAAS